MKQISARPHRQSIPFVVLLVIFLIGCNSGRREQTEQYHGRPVVVTTNYPLKYFSDRITLGGCDIVYPVPEGISPEAWKPDERAMTEIQTADRVLTNGPRPVEWLREANPPADHVVDTTEIFEGSLLRTDATSATAVDPNSPAPIDRLTWLNPKLASHQAETCLETLARLNPPEALEYQRRFEELRQELAKLDSRLTAITNEYADEPLLAAAPQFNYLSQRCGLKLKSLDWPVDKMPGEAKWNELKSILKGHPAKWMFWPSAPKPDVAERLKSLGIDTVIFDPCETPPRTGDFLDTMQRNYRRLEEVFVSLAATPIQTKRSRLPTDLRMPEGAKDPAAPTPESPPRRPGTVGGGTKSKTTP